MAMAQRASEAPTVSELAGQLHPFIVEIEQRCGASWEEITAKARACLLEGIEEEYRAAFLALIHDEPAAAIHEIGRVLNKGKWSISHWKNPEYQPISLLTIWQGFAALDQVVKTGQIPRGRQVVREATKRAIGAVCRDLLQVARHDWSHAHCVAMLETRKPYWDEARQNPQLRTDAMRRLLTSVRSFSAQRLRWNFDQIEQWRLTWETGWEIYRDAVDFDWAESDDHT